MDLEFDESLLTVHINHNNFPAKLWCLTNDPQHSCVSWGPAGESLMVDQRRFEAELLSPAGDQLKLFKTSNFSSFVRQLNLYGFRKLSDGSPRRRRGDLHHFHNPHFRQGRPELLVHLKRLTISNKAKMQAGEQVTCRAPSRGHQRPKSPDTETAGSSPQLQRSELLLPPQPWLFPYSHRGVPLPLVRPYPYRVQARPAVLFPQEAKYVPHHLPYPPGFYPPVCPCCPAGVLEADGAADPACLSYSHYAYYSQKYPVSLQTSGWAGHSSAESQRADVNLDRVFQMVDDFQGLPAVHTVRVGTPGPQRSSSSPQASPAASDGPRGPGPRTATLEPDPASLESAQEIRD